jgi:hypothetical protein
VKAMTEQVKRMTPADYVAECKRIAGERWDECRELYSFVTARNNRMSPEEAVKDCLDWIDGVTQ